MLSLTLTCPKNKIKQKNDNREKWLLPFKLTFKLRGEAGEGGMGGRRADGCVGSFSGLDPDCPLSQHVREEEAEQSLEYGFIVRLSWASTTRDFLVRPKFLRKRPNIQGYQGMRPPLRVRRQLSGWDDNDEGKSGGLTSICSYFLSLLKYVPAVPDRCRLRLSPRYGTTSRRILIFWVQRKFIL